MSDSPGPSSSKKAKLSSSLVKVLEDERSKIEFQFKKQRLRFLSDTQEVPEDCNGILYWMSRDMRVQDNWAFLYAQKLALKNEVALHVCFCLLPKFLDATLRHFQFMLDGLQEVESECTRLGINFHLQFGESGKIVPKFVQDNKFGALIVDFSPLRGPLSWIETAKKALPDEIPFIQIDAHNIVPIWVTSDKQEYAARTIRKKVTNNLGTFLTSFPPVVKHKFKATVKVPEINWKTAFDTLDVDESVGRVKWCQPGYRAGIEMLESFCEKRLKIFGDKRNDPTIDALSNLSPWFHFVQRAILQVNKYKSKYKAGVEAFNEEAIVRRELSDNFCFYNQNYDNLQGVPSWALKTLNDHRKDKREYVYTQKELEDGHTHDDLWNAAQNQLRMEGKLHGFLRMYWAKKILEWTVSPEEALRITIYLNDRFSMDGRDPNGFVGCMWSIGGVHDQGWKERQVFGKIRYMNYEGCKRKFDINAFIVRYGGKKYPYKKK